MPDYRATRFINTREADTYRFTAENDQAAKEMLLSGAALDWSGDADLIDCEVSDEVLAPDRRKEDGSYQVIEDEIELPGQMPYGQPSRQFVLNVAALGEEGAYDDAFETLQRLIQLARTLCNIPQPIVPDPQSLHQGEPA